MSEPNSQTNTETAPETINETQTVTDINETAEQTPVDAEFTDIEAEVKALNTPKQTYEKALNDSEPEPEEEPETDTEEEEADPEGKTKKTKVIDSEFVDEGAEMMFNVSDFAFSGLNSWLNKEPDKAEDYEATQKGKRLIVKNLKAYFRTFEIKITPGQALLYSYIVVYGFDFVAGVFTRVKDLFKKLLAKKPPAPKPQTKQPEAEQPGGLKVAPPEPAEQPVSELTEDEIKKALRSKKEEAYRKQGLKPCNNPDCNKDEGHNQWCAQDRKFCSGSCRTIVQNKKKKEEKAKK